MEVVIDAEAMVQNKIPEWCVCKMFDQFFSFKTEIKKDENTKTLTRATKILHPTHASDRSGLPDARVACVRRPVHGHSQEDES